jgi:hypothetical protein
MLADLAAVSTCAMHWLLFNLHGHLRQKKDLASTLLHILRTKMYYNKICFENAAQYKTLEQNRKLQKIMFNLKFHISSTASILK